MRKIAATCLVILLAVSCKTDKQNIDAETVWGNYLKHCGDTAKINQIMSVKIITESTQSDHVKSVFEYMMKDGDKIFMHFNSPEMDAVTKYDGQTFSRRINGQKEEVLESEKKGILRYCDFAHELHYKKHGFNLELMGVEKVDAKEAYKLKYFLGDLVSYYFIDVENFNLVKIEDKNGEFWPIETKEMGGYRYFSKYKTKDKFATAVCNVLSVELNPELNDSIFRE